MRARLALLQFPFLFCPAAVIGLAIYGADFNSAVGYVYLVPLILLPLALPRLGAGVHRFLRRHARVIASAGVVLGALAYRPLHLAPWEGHSYAQALSVCGLGIASGTVSWLAAGAAHVEPGGSRWKPTAVLTLVAAAFYLARWYPMIPLLAVSLALAAAVMLPWDPTAGEPSPRARGTLFASTLAFYLAAQMGEAVWDLGADPSWARLLAVAFLSAGATALVPGLIGKGATGAGSRPVAPAGMVALGVAVTAGLATAALPAFVVSPWRHALLGVALGAFAVAVLDRAIGTADGAAAAQHVWLWFTVGLAVSHMYSAQLLAVPAGRLAFAVPAVLGLLLERRTGGGKHEPEQRVRV